MDGSAHLVKIERFGHRGRAHPLEKALRLQVERVPCDEDEPLREAAVEAPYLVVESRTVELRHSEITQDHVIGAFPELLQGDRPIAGLVDPMAVDGQNVGQEIRDSAEAAKPPRDCITCTGARTPMRCSP